jgi:hypothetical protein
MDPQPKEFDRSPEFFVAEIAHQWVSSIDRKAGGDITINKKQDIDPEKGVFFDILEIRIGRQMERVAQDVKPAELEPLPAIPAASALPA